MVLHYAGYDKRRIPADFPRRLMLEALKEFRPEADPGWLLRQWARALEELLTSVQARIKERMRREDTEALAQVLVRGIELEAAGDEAAMRNFRLLKDAVEAHNSFRPFKLFLREDEETPDLKEHPLLCLEVISAHW